MPRDAPRWNYAKWGVMKRTKDAQANPSDARQALLERSLQAARGAKDNEDALRELVDKCLEADLFDLAKEAVGAFAKGSDFQMYVSIGKVFDDPEHWDEIEEDFADYCERRVLNGPMARSGMKWLTAHYVDQRSTALGVLGKYRFFTGSPERAYELWSAGGEPFDTDEAMLEVCKLIGKHESDRLAEAISVAENMRTASQQARAFALLSEFA